MPMGDGIYKLEYNKVLEEHISSFFFKQHPIDITVPDA